MTRRIPTEADVDDAIERLGIQMWEVRQLSPGASEHPDAVALRCLWEYPSVFIHRHEVMAHVFATLGNGYSWEVSDRECDRGLLVARTPGDTDPLPSHAELIRGYVYGELQREYDSGRDLPTHNALLAARIDRARLVHLNIGKLYTQRSPVERLYVDGKHLFDLVPPIEELAPMWRVELRIFTRTCIAAGYELNPPFEI